MKRLFLICIVALAIVWTGYSSYELWFNAANKITPQSVFCEKDQSVLLINNFDEINPSDYLALIEKNPLSSEISALDSIYKPGIRYYISGQRPLILIQGAEKWSLKKIDTLKKYFHSSSLTFKHNGNFLLISKQFSPCTQNNADFLNTADKKASANYWEYNNHQWKRTDVYQLNEGFYKYQSSSSTTNFGKPVKDISLFASVIPASITHYLFQERFYAENKDSVLKNGPMHLWLDKGFAQITFNNQTVLVSDYRSQQVPELVLKEQLKNGDNYTKLKDMSAFKDFQLTRDFPRKKGSTFYVFEIENKAFFTESKETARKIMVEYQLGNTLALQPDQEAQFFEGLPSHVNYREVSEAKKMSITWKGSLRFEVSSRPPKERLQNRNKLMWSAPIDYAHPKLVTIYDHLRDGISVFTYDNKGNFKLIGPNGGKIWQGQLSSPLKGNIQVIDVFNNNKHQFLFHSDEKVYLIDLNGNSVGGFPFEANHKLTSNLSTFTWEGSTRFLVGNENGQIIMLSNDGKPIKTVRVSHQAIQQPPYALNVSGNLRVWTIDNQNKQFLAYLEKSKKATKKETSPGGYCIKNSGKIIHYFEKDDAIYYTSFNSSNNTSSDAQKLTNGTIVKCTKDYILTKQKDNYNVFDHHQTLIYQKQLSFNDVAFPVFIPEKKILIVMDAVDRKSVV